MKITHSNDIPQNEAKFEGSSGCLVQILVGKEDRAPNFVMRKFEVAPGGHTPRHFHDYEHEVYVLEGQGAVVDGDAERPIHPGDVIYVAPDDVHQFRNTGDVPLKFLCMIPNSATSKQVTVVPECGLEVN